MFIIKFRKSERNPLPGSLVHTRGGLSGQPWSAAASSQAGPPQAWRAIVILNWSRGLKLRAPSCADLQAPFPLPGVLSHQICLTDSYSSLQIWLKYHLLQEALPDISKKHFLLCSPNWPCFMSIKLFHCYSSLPKCLSPLCPWRPWSPETTLPATV